MSQYVLIASVLVAIVVGIIAITLIGGEESETPPDLDEVVQHEADDAEEDDESESTAAESVSELLAVLPYEITASGRTVTVDKDTVASSTRDSYAALPYEITVGESTQLIEAEMVLRQGESPLAFTERFIAERLPEEDRLATYNDDMYETTASVYELSEDIVAEYPMADEVTPAEEGVSVFVRRMNFPDDSIGGREDRFDFIRSNGGWILVWLGERTYCRRPGDEFWQPADRLCP